MFNSFINSLSAELKKDLPGFSAQKTMAPLGRKPPAEYLKKDVNPKSSAVLILLYPKLVDVCTVLIVRPEKEGSKHAGQIAFPGGGFEVLDKDLSETALRETEEEIGVNRNSISLLGSLTPLYIPVSNYMMHPFVGAVNSPPQFNLEPSEVDGIVEVGLYDFVSENSQSSIERFVNVRGTSMKVPCYEINGKIIWGATAMIIAEFSEIIRRIK